MIVFCFQPAFSAAGATKKSCRKDKLSRRQLFFCFRYRHSPIVLKAYPPRRKRKDPRNIFASLSVSRPENGFDISVSDGF